MQSECLHFDAVAETAHDKNSICARLCNRHAQILQTSSIYPFEKTTSAAKVREGLLIPTLDLHQLSVIIKQAVDRDFLPEPTTTRTRLILNQNGVWSVVMVCCPSKAMVLDAPRQKE